MTAGKTKSGRRGPVRSTPAAPTPARGTRVSPVLPPDEFLRGVYTSEEVMLLLRVGSTYAGKVIHDLNEELSAQGFRPFKPGTISKLYFHQRYYCNFDVAALTAAQAGKGGEGCAAV